MYRYTVSDQIRIHLSGIQGEENHSRDTWFAWNPIYEDQILSLCLGFSPAGFALWWSTGLGKRICGHPRAANRSLLLVPLGGSTRFPKTHHLQTIVSETPQHQKQVSVRVRAINATHNCTSTVTDDGIGVELQQPRFISTTGDKQVVEALRWSVGLQIQVDATVCDAPAMLQPRRNMPNGAAPANSTKSSIHPPPMLLKDRITSNPTPLHLMVLSWMVLSISSDC